MVSLYPLVRNETLKIWKKNRFLVVLLILLVLIPMFTYAQMKSAESVRKQSGTTDWRIMMQTRLNEAANRLGSTRVPEEWKQYIRVDIQRLQFYLDHDINPSTPNGVTFARDFIRNSLNLFLPLMVVVIAADLVSAEYSAGTIKLLLTRPVRRWKILMSKGLALSLYVGLIIVAALLLAYMISGFVFGYGGWTEPVLTGFLLNGSDVDVSRVHAVRQWLYILMECGLAWFSCMTVACLSLMVSVLVRSVAAGMGIMLAVLISGTILTNMVSSWPNAKYLFMVHLDLVVYLAGSVPAIPGLTLPFSLLVLAGWSVAGLAVAFGAFIYRDVM